MSPRRAATTVAAVLLLAAALYAGVRGVAPAPPLGPLLDPANGVWAVAATAELPRTASARVPGLGERVEVRYDDRGVPHIFASSEEDAYRALGYVVARDRLFQLEIQTRAASGRLSELVGRIALDADRYTRDLGMPRAAEQKLAALMGPQAGSGPSAGARAIAAYADGVNAWIDQMGPRDLPLEYHLLGRRPMRWEPINTAHLLNRMGWTLAYSEDELLHLRAEARVGRAAADALFPVNSPIQEPIQPADRAQPRFDYRRLPPPGEPDSAAMVVLRVVDAGFGIRDSGFADALSGWPPRAGAGPSVVPESRIPNPESRLDALGSNNWAVAPQRTGAGYALLAGDPHLELTLPSTWYEVHLVVPGRLDVYGVTIPGAPGVVLGFNRDVAWTFSNTGADVMDYYAETVDDPAGPTRYRLDGAWRPVETRVEHYRGQRGEVIATDTLRFTHRGPLRRLAGRWVSTRWTVLEPSNESDALIRAAQARSVAEWMEAMASYAVPAQNMLVADRAGTIAIRSTGRFPVRPGDGRGDVLRDGSTSASDWRGAWPVAEYPQATRPAQGYLASANQQPVDPAANPRYLGSGWPAPWRAMRINALLRADSAVTPDAMRRYQTDPGSARADLFVPAFLRAAKSVASTPVALMNQGPYTDTIARAAELLAQWDRRYTRDNRRAVLFEYAMRELSRRLWDELRDPGDDARRVAPSDVVTAMLLEDPASPWWDDRRTVGVAERRDDILAASLAAALSDVTREHGAPDAGGWRWDRIRHANIHHLLRIPAFSALGIPLQGGSGTLNPSSGSGTHGASWRMVVELGPELRAWGTYPGGQSGNPASRRYADRLARWTAGELDSLRVARRPEELGRVTSTLTLAPARR